MRIDSAKQLNVYVKAYDLSMRILRHSEYWPRCEQYALTSRIRRSSRSVCLNLWEAWAKRRYENHFISKLTDCDGAANETDSALDFARDCGYITVDEHGELVALCDEVRRMLGGMLAKPEAF